MDRPEITQEYLKTLFDYVDGNLVTKTTRGCLKTGTIAGTIKTDLYRSIVIDRKSYCAHRLIWLYVYGKFPDNYIDHINHDRSDNRIENLRDVTISENNRNRKTFPNNYYNKLISYRKQNEQ